MAPPTKEQVLGLLRSGTPAERAAFLAQLPPASFKDSAAGLFGSGNPGMVVVAITPLIQEYCFGSHPELGAVLADAAHERALEIARTVPDHGLLPTTLSGLACHHVRALAQLGRSAEVLAATARYLPLYEQMNERENLSTLKVLRVDALVNLGRADEAEAALKDQALLDDPVNGMEAQRLKRWVDQYRADATQTRAEWQPAPAGPSASSMQAMLNKVLELGGMGELGAAVRQQLDPANRLDPADPAQHKRLLDLLSQGEQLLMRGAGGGSEIALRARIRNATAIFVHGKPDANTIRRSLGELEASLAEARKAGIAEHEHDALWGIYLCNNRLGQAGLAADALIALRGGLERLRRGISDPMRRGGVFSAYRYLFNALCEQLHKSGRTAELLEAVESSKGRVIADRLTAASGQVMDDAATYRDVARLPELTRRERFHYLTFFVDESCAYAVLVSKQGTLHTPAPVPISDTDLRAAAARVGPAAWKAGAPTPPTQLAPMVAWLAELRAQGVVEDGDHLCYSSDDDFSNVPLHYLAFGSGILLDHFSVSRVHSAFHLQRLLDRAPTAAPAAFIGVVVPMQGDLQGPGAEAFLKNLDAPPKWLADHGLDGRSIRLAEATPARLAGEALARRVVHFSTHGWFPPQGGNPYRESFLLLADDHGLPEPLRLERGQHAGKLTPAGILEAGLDLAGSHVSMMACVSGLAREGIAGDTLGLDWAFIQAGATSLISTHWEVSASAAARFFSRFYSRWIDDEQPRAAAFRDTMLELLHGDHSAGSLQQWAAFSLTGDFR
ncbi:MAG: CHAT domain-containing protein [Rubrivivax sp.]|nr:CHAT domain-containing protein [Rubrivivax sp.]